MKRCCKNGFALLETAGILAGLLGAVFGVVALADYLNQHTAIERALGRWIRADAVKPFNVAINSSGDPSLVVNQTALNSFISEAADKLVLEIEQSGFSSNAPFVEIGYALLAYNPVTGQRLTTVPVFTIQHRGAAISATEMPQCPDLATQANNFLSSHRENGATTDLGAIPDSRFQTGNGGYLPYSVVIVGRAARDLRGSFVGKAFGALGSTRVTYSCVTTLLRGELGNL